MKIKNWAIVAAGATGVIFALAAPLAMAQMSTGTLGTNIDTVSNTVLDYLGVLLTKYWPFVIIGVILVGVFSFGKRLIGRLFGA